MSMLKKSLTGFICFAILYKNGEPYSLWGYATDISELLFYPFDKMSAELVAELLGNSSIAHFDMDLNMAVRQAIRLQNGTSIIFSSDFKCLTVSHAELELLMKHSFISVVNFKNVFYVFGKDDIGSQLASYNFNNAFAKEFELSGLQGVSMSGGLLLIIGPNITVSSLVVPYGIAKVHAYKIGGTLKTLVVPETVTSIVGLEDIKTFGVRSVLTHSRRISIDNSFNSGVNLDLSNCTDVFFIRSLAQGFKLLNLQRGIFSLDGATLSSLNNLSDTWLANVKIPTESLWNKPAAFNPVCYM